MSAPLQISSIPVHSGSLAAVRRVIVNITSLLTSDIVSKAATFAVYALVARNCGPRSFGQLSLGLTLLYTFQVFAAAGLPTLITREIAKHRASSGRYFANASLIVVCSFVLSLIILALFVLASRYPRDTSEIIVLLGVGILPCSLTTINEAVLIAWEKMHCILLIYIPVNAFKVGAAYYLLSTGHGVRSVVLLTLGCFFATLLLEWPVVFHHLRWQHVAINTRFCRALLNRTWRFLGIDSLVSLWGSINTVLLSWICSEAAVGLFNAAWQLLVPARMMLQAIVSSLYPVMCRRAEESRERFRQLTVLLLEILAVIAVPSCILLYFGAAPIINTLYSNRDFAGSVVVLRIMQPVLILHAVAATFGLVLFSHRHERRTLRIVTLVVAFNLVSGTMLIYAYGVVGAAISHVLTCLLNGCLHYAAARDCLTDNSGGRLPWSDTLIGSVLAAGCIMAAALALTAQLNFIVATILTSFVYVVVLAGLVCAACRGSLGARERFLVPLGEK